MSSPNYRKDTESSPKAGHRGSRYEELMGMTTRSFEMHQQYPSPEPRPNDSRIVDTFYESPVGPTAEHPSMHTQFFKRSLDKADQFPLHKQLLLGTWKKREVQEASFGDSPSLYERVPNFHVRALSAPKRTRNCKAFYEGKYMATVMEHKYPDMIYLTPGMNPIPQVRAVAGGRGYLPSTDAPPSTSDTTTRDYDATMMGSTVGGSPTGRLTEADVLYKHKRQYAADFPMLADRFHPELTATQRRMEKEQEARVVRMKQAAAGGGGESQLDPQCRFRPVALQQVTPVHPEYASGNPVSSSYAMCGQVSALPYDTTKRIRTAAATQRRRAMGKEPSYDAVSTSSPRPRKERSKTGLYAVTTYSSFAAAASPTVNSTRTRSFASGEEGTGGEGGEGASKSIYAAPVPRSRPPVRIAVHPSRR